MGVIISFINPEFNLVYKLIGFKELIDRYIGLNIFECFLNILKLYLSILYNTILR